MKNGILKFACLISIALWILISFSTDAFAQTNRGMGVSPEALPKALRDLSPRDLFVTSNQKKVGVIHALEGKLVVVHRAAQEAFFGMEGDPVFENDALHTLADSRCRIRFLDEDVVTMAPETEFSVDSFQDQRAEGKKSSVFSMAKGRAMFYAMRLFQYKDTRFTLNTPTVTVGVRGTKFGVHVFFAGEEKRAERGIRVADRGNEIAPYLAQAGGPPSFTDAFSEDGILDVSGRVVGPGQMFNGQTRQVNPTPPDMIRSFRQATDMGVQGQQARTTPPGGPVGDTQPLTGTGVQQSQTSTSDLTNLVTNQTSVQTGVQTEMVVKKEAGIVPYTGYLYGYFATLIRKNPLQDAFLNYQSGYSPGTFYNGSGNDDMEGNFLAHGVRNSSDYVKSTGAGASGYDEAYIGGYSGEWGKSWRGIENWVGQNEYAQWGYWHSNTPTSFTLGSNTYSFVNDQGWAVMAKHITTATEIAAVAYGDYAYKGEAHGTYYNGSAAANMSGTFSSTVHFGSAYVKDFNLNVSGGGHSAAFVQSGTANVSSGSSGNYFATSSGTATIDGASVAYKQVSGSLVGSAAQGMVGAWGMGCSSTGVGAAGIYSGIRAAQ